MILLRKNDRNKKFLIETITSTFAYQWKCLIRTSTKWWIKSQIVLYISTLRLWSIVTKESKRISQKPGWFALFFFFSKFLKKQTVQFHEFNCHKKVVDAKCNICNIILFFFFLSIFQFTELMARSFWMTEIRKYCEFPFCFDTKFLFHFEQASPRIVPYRSRPHFVLLYETAG